MVKAMSMEGRLTLCNLSIEMGARGGFIAPDEVTFEYVKGKEYAPKGEAWDKALAYWKTLKSGDDAVFDKELAYEACDIQPRVTYGTNPGMGIGITETIPTEGGVGFQKALDYMGFKAGEQLLGKKIDYVFLGAHGLLIVRFVRKDWSRCLKLQASRFANQVVALAWP